MTSGNNSELDECLKTFQAGKAPKDEKDFYVKSFNLFLKLHQTTKDLNLTGITKPSKQLIEDIIYGYSTLCHSYISKSHWAKVWDLCQILYFSDDDDYTERLLDWLNEYEPRETSRLEDYILRGDWDNAIGILVDLEQVWGAQTIREALEKIDSDDNWRQELADNLDSKQLSPELSRVYRILLGDETIYEEFGLAERLVAIVRFSRPGLPRIELHSLAQRIYEKAEDQVCDYLLMGMVDNALGEANDLWLQTHLGHAFISVHVKSAQTFQLSGDVIVDPVYLSMNEYVKSIVKEEMWKEAVIYLSTCKENGQAWIKELFGEPPLNETSIDNIKQVLDVAYEYNLDQTQKILHAALGKRYEGVGDIDQAVVEYAKAHNIHDLDRLAQDGLSQYLEKGELKNVVADMDEVKISPLYALLVNYQEFRTHLNAKEFKEASNLFSHMMTSKDLLPSKFDTVLMFDNYAILEDKGTYYTFEQFLEVIQLFKAMVKDESKYKFAHVYYNRSQSDKLSAELVWAKLRERLGYKAALSQEQ